LVVNLTVLPISTTGALSGGPNFESRSFAGPLFTSAVAHADIVVASNMHEINQLSLLGMILPP
jgi:hypothetical protein